MVELKLERMKAGRIPISTLRRIRPKVLGGDLAPSTTESLLEKDDRDVRGLGDGLQPLADGAKELRHPGW